MMRVFSNTVNPLVFPCIETFSLTFNGSARLLKYSGTALLH